MNRDKWLVAIIDEGIDMSKINCFFPNILIKLRLIKGCHNFISRDFHLNHGTLCTLLFLEALEKYHLLEKVEIIYLPITRIDGSKNIKELIKALKYCQQKKFDFILMSLGINHMIYAKTLSGCIDEIYESILIASESNDLTISFPASLSTVIGVKRSNNSKKKITRIVDSYDGIELEVPCYESKILNSLKFQYGLDYSLSNSILVPYTAAEIIKKIESLKLKKISKEEILSFFEVIDTKTKITNIKNNGNTILMINYTKDNYFDLQESLTILQSTFIKNMYNCYILTDAIKQSNFKILWLKLFSQDINQDICNYCNAIYDGLIILFVDYHVEEKILFEYLKYDLKSQIDKLNDYDKVMNDILEKFS